MIKSVNITNPKGENLLLELKNPYASGLGVRKIDGLGPPSAQVNYQELYSADGAVFNGSRVQVRNITMDLIMFGTPSIEDARQKTYRYFPIKKPIKIGIETDNRKLECVGYVESNEPDIFSEQEGCSISIICPDPFFYKSGDSATVFAGVRPKFEFEFPWEGDEWTSVDPQTNVDMIEFGEQMANTRAILNYEGDIDTGVIIEIQVLDSAEDIRIYNDDTEEMFAIDTQKIAQLTGSNLGAGDMIYISTKVGEKYVKLLRNGVYTNIISAVDRNSDWFQVSTGENTFWYTTRIGSGNLMVAFVYRDAYGGI